MTGQVSGVYYVIVYSWQSILIIQMNTFLIISGIFFFHSVFRRVCVKPKTIESHFYSKPYISYVISINRQTPPQPLPFVRRSNQIRPVRSFQNVSVCITTGMWRTTRRLTNRTLAEPTWFQTVFKHRVRRTRSQTEKKPCTTIII